MRRGRGERERVFAFIKGSGLPGQDRFALAMYASNPAGWFTERGSLVVIRPCLRHFPSWVHRLFMLVSYLKERVSRQTQRVHLLLVGVLCSTSHQ